MKLWIGAGMMGLASLSPAALILDDFTTGPYDFTTSTVGPYTTNLQPGSMLGGYRMVVSHVLANPISIAEYHFFVGGGIAFADAGSRLVHETTLTFGNEPAGPPGGFNPKDLNLDALASGDNAFRLDFLSNDLPLAVQVNVRSSEQNGGAWVSIQHVVAGGRATTPFTEDFQFSEFAGFDFHDVDQIAINFTNTAGGDFALSKIETVPEPATLAALGIGLAALAARRRRR